MKAVKTSRVGAKYQKQIIQNEIEKKETPLIKEISSVVEREPKIQATRKTLDTERKIKELESIIKKHDELLIKILKILRG